MKFILTANYFAPFSFKKAKILVDPSNFPHVPSISLHRDKAESGSSNGIFLLFIHFTVIQCAPASSATGPNLQLAREYPNKSHWGFSDIQVHTRDKCKRSREK